jgi:hypothetical protein
MRQALELALEALERSVATCFDQRSHDEVMGRPEHFVNKAIIALRLAIDVQNMASESTYKEALAQKQDPVVERAWFTIAELNAWADKKLAENPNWVMPTEEPERKEALAQKQEPVGQLLEDAFGRGQVMWFNKPKDESMLYTTPPQRTWVGLTDEEIADCAEKMEASDPTDSFWREFFRGIEAKLKEKNT